MTKSIELMGLAALVVSGSALTSTPSWANDFPTQDRVVYVQECMRNHPGPHHEMVSKCACALDALAEQVDYATYVEMATAFNANTIGGERGSEIRDNPSLQEQIKRYKSLQASVKKGCFINTADVKK